MDKGRNDLVLPIYYIRCRLLEDPSLRQSDPLASSIHERQWEDWRERRFKPFEDPEVRRSLEALATKIDDARSRAKDEEREQAEDERRAREKEACRRGDEEGARSRAEGEPRGRAKRQAGKSRRNPAPKGLEAGTVFRDKDEPWCPELVVIPPGEFMMGSTEVEREWAIKLGVAQEWVEREKPQRLVRIAYPLAVGRYSVTFEEYGYCARTTGRAQPSDEGWGRSRRPVINVDWEDAKFFIAWLSVQTRQRYRLLSEVEWEYACRAGTKTRYWRGDEITPESANYGRNVGKTSKVGSYPANHFGLYDMHGNLWECVEDCWNDSYEGGPKDGRAWSSGDCARRVLRGGLLVRRSRDLSCCHPQ